MKIAITGAGGLIGWHAAARLHARNCAARFRGDPDPFAVVMLDHAGFDDPQRLADALHEADAVLHFAGVNHASDADVESGNPAIAATLLAACRAASSTPHIVYANSTHAASDTPYGRSKRRAGGMLARAQGRYTNLVLPHIFGECARPRYNNVTATFVEAVIAGHRPEVNPEGHVALLHAGAAAEAAIGAVLAGQTGDLAPEPRPVGVPDLLDKLAMFHADYQANVFPEPARWL